MEELNYKHEPLGENEKNLLDNVSNAVTAYCKAEKIELNRCYVVVKDGTYHIRVVKTGKRKVIKPK